MDEGIGNRLGNLLGLAIVAAVVFLFWVHFFDHRILEVKCVLGTALDPQKRCLNILRAGATIEAQVNTARQKAVIKILKNDGNYFGDEMFFEDCAIISESDWQCKQGKAVTETLGMKDGRYYNSVEDNLPPNYYTSSIRGAMLWLYEYNVIDLNKAQQFNF
ncbi:MAG: hypothetical protein KGO53_03930 [Alphaproteobacteria bacterium]|nr:hypothetical protein [Alphaproteobacteria bacterium]